jgi:hypothetical protein
VRALAAVCVLGAAAIAAPAHATFNPVEFFHGRTHGEGTLKVLFQASKHISVDSEGRAEPDGVLLLKQVINEAGKPPRTRYWRLRQTGPARFEGTLTDAASPVRVDVANETVRIRYTGKDNLDFDEVLTPVSPTEVHNRIRVKRFGIVVAHFEETIRKLD